MTEIKNRIIGSGVEALDQIMFNPRNWRVHPLNQQNALKGVLEEVGWVQEVIINKRTGNLVDGHLRCQLAAREGAKTIPVKYVDLSEDEEALVLATIDPIAAMATTDKAKLDELFASIESENADVLKMLDDIAEKERLEYAKREPVDAEPQIDRAAELNEKWRVVTGDLWQIGEHRLLCGDSTKREDVERVMAGAKADMVLTDPPYGVDYSSKNEFLNQYDKGARVQTAIENDAIDDYKTFYFDFINAIPFAGTNTIYVFMQGKHYPELAWAFDENGIYRSEDLVWVKNNHVLGRQDYSHKHELILYGWKDKHIFYRGFSTTVIDDDTDVEKLKKDELIEIVREFKKHLTTVIRANKPLQSEFHPTTKPTSLVNKLIQDGSLNGFVIYDPFIGSGTTMVACQNLNRKCRAIEISPNYCAVILERMHTAFPELEIKRV